jgi:hypothetical protein
MVFLFTASTICGAQPLALALHVDGVLERAGDDVGAAAHHRAQRLRAAGEVDDLRLQAFGLEVAQRLGHRQRQVIEQVLAAHRQRELGLFDRLRAHDGGAGEGGGSAGEEDATLHGVDSGRRLRPL